MRILIVGALILSAVMMSACGSSESTASKKDEATFKDRNPADIKGPPAGFAPKGPPPGAAGPPPGATK